MSNALIAETPEQIARLRLATLKGALKLESLGMRKRGQSALAIAKSMGFKGNRETIIAAIAAKLAS